MYRLNPPLIGPEMKYIVVVRVSVTSTSIMIPFVEEKMYYQQKQMRMIYVEP
jgi:hypothetical protein